MDYIDKLMKDTLSTQRKAHIKAVEKMASQLADIYGADKEKCILAAYYHDCLKGISIAQMNDMIKELGLDRKYLDNKNLAHGKVAAALLEREGIIKDKDVLNAISYHTTGTADMDILGEIIYVSDGAEEGRDYPGVSMIRELAYKDIDKACLLMTERTIDYLTEQGVTIDEDTIKARDWFINHKGD